LFAVDFIELKQVEPLWLWWLVSGIEEKSKNKRWYSWW